METHKRLREIIKEKALIVKEDITLTSGLKSNFFFDMKAILLSAEGANLITKEILKTLRGVQFDYVGGMESGAIPIVTLICATSIAAFGRSVDGFYVRKKEKSHGERRNGIDNGIEGNLKGGSKVVIVDDVTTTGNSIGSGIDKVRKAGGEVVKAITIVDRNQGAKENLARRGIKLISLFSKEDFGLKG